MPMKADTAGKCTFSLVCSALSDRELAALSSRAEKYGTLDLQLLLRVQFLPFVMKILNVIRSRILFKFRTEDLAVNSTIAGLFPHSHEHFKRKKPTKLLRAQKVTMLRNLTTWLIICVQLKFELDLLDENSLNK